MIACRGLSSFCSPRIPGGHLHARADQWPTRCIGVVESSVALERDLFNPCHVLVTGTVAVHPDLKHVDKIVVPDRWLEWRGHGADHEHVLVMDLEDLLPEFQPF